MRGHIQRRGKKSWRLKFDAGRDPITGERFTKYMTVRGNKSDAQRELTKALHEIDTGTFVEPSKITVAEFLEQWLGSLANQGLSPKTYDRYQEMVNINLVPALGPIPLAKLEPIHIETAWSAALESGRIDGKGGLSPITVAHVHRLLKQALKKAVKWKMLATNPADMVDAPKVGQREIAVLTETELADLINAVKGTALYMPVMLASTTGLRRGEVLGLRWKDIDLDRGTLTVTQTLGQARSLLYFKPPKTKAGRRTVTLPTITIEALRMHKIRQLEERLKLGLGRDDGGLVFTRPDGQPVIPASFSRTFCEFVKNRGLPPISFHGLRHSHLSHLLRAGIHPKVASARAGHSSVTITMDVYSHILPGMQEEAAMKIDAVLRTALEQ